MSEFSWSGVLWSGLGLVAPLRARVLGMPPEGVGGISIDTRTLAPGDLFFAIKGDNSDGHDYVGAAFARGAAAAVVDEVHADALKHLGTLYIVHDVLQALEGLGRAARKRSKARIIAVTGSVGKTSTKEALRKVLSDAAPTHASDKSYNNHWGVPLMLARLPDDFVHAGLVVGFGPVEHADRRMRFITGLPSLSSSSPSSARLGSSKESGNCIEPETAHAALRPERP